MQFFPAISAVSRDHVSPGFFAMLAMNEDKPVFGMLVEPARQGRKADFLRIGPDRFRVWYNTAGTGIDQFLIIPDARAVIPNVIAGEARCCRRIPPAGSLVLAGGRAAVIGIAGEEHNEFALAFDLETGMQATMDSPYSICFPNWRIVVPCSEGGSQVVLAISALVQPGG